MKKKKPTKRAKRKQRPLTGPTPPHVRFAQPGWTGHAQDNHGASRLRRNETHVEDYNDA